MEQARIVLTTVSSRDEAALIARALVEERLAACVNIIGDVNSIYRWKDAVEEASEILLLIKSSTEKLDALESAVSRLHSYDVPEFIVLPVEGGSHAYLKWLHESL
ncbi:MAG TPA: divalent-cation tolerance protein CutA [Pseudacidobacterium sp.]|jgi:periplasmic divalent cation tolerance protein|nr:divalent-cation tolerance protein CutA [Pseudacidobacterium sp.]